MPVIVPSWVVPGTAVDNAAFLAGKVRGIMLCCFECAPQLPAPVPGASCGLEWHVHLPTDLPWQAGGQQAAVAAWQAVAHAAHLFTPATRAIVHAPPRADLLDAFLRAWRAESSAPDLVLENPPHADAAALELCRADTGIPLCLDVAHLALCPPGPRTQMLRAIQAGREVGMMHWSAPRGARDAHLPLADLDARRKKLYRYIAAHVHTGHQVIEVFAWNGILASWHVLRDWRAAATT